MGMAGVPVVWEGSDTPQANQETAICGFFFSTDLSDSLRSVEIEKAKPAILLSPSWFQESWQ